MTEAPGETVSGVTIRLSSRAARVLLRSLYIGEPMAGPDVIPLIEALADALDTEESPSRGRT